MSNRTALLAKIHIAKKQLSLDDDTYRDALETATGERSAGKCNIDQLTAVIEAFRAKGWQDRPAGSTKRAPRQAKAPGGRLANSPHASKLRALWLSAWNLGVVRDSSESALGAFIKRQTGIDAMVWLAPEDAPRAIEALKDWMAREADVDWPKASAPAQAHRIAVVEAQWRQLAKIGAVEVESEHAIAYFAKSVLGWPVIRGHQAMTNPEADKMIRVLGKKLREAQDRRSQADAKAAQQQ